MNRRMTTIAACLLAVVVVTGFSWAQGPPHGRGPGGRGHGARGHGMDAEFRQDHAVIHFLLANHKQISRKVTLRKDGVETWTESENPKIAAAIREHVRAMYKRVEKKKPIRHRDPLFNMLFRNTEKIEMKLEDTKQGLHVIETSKDAYTVKLIQAHAKVVSLFVKYGHTEARKTHQAPQ